MLDLPAPVNGSATDNKDEPLLLYFHLYSRWGLQARPVSKLHFL